MSTPRKVAMQNGSNARTVCKAHHTRNLCPRGVIALSIVMQHMGYNIVAVSTRFMDYGFPSPQADILSLGSFIIL